MEINQQSPSSQPQNLYYPETRTQPMTTQDRDLDHPIQSSTVPQEESKSITSTKTPRNDVIGRLTQGTAEKLHKVAASFRAQSSQFPDIPSAEKIASSTADVIDSTALYIEKTSTDSLKKGVTNQMTKHPWMTLSMALGFGIWVGRTLKRS